MDNTNDEAKKEMIMLKLNVLFPTSKFTYMGEWQQIQKNEFTTDHSFEGVDVRVRVFEPLNPGDKKTLVYAML